MDQVQYWDVLPKSIKVMWTDVPISIPLSIHGNPRGNVIFESVHPGIATVDSDGRLSLGALVGSTMIIVYDNEDRTSARYVQVEVTINENFIEPI